MAAENRILEDGNNLITASGDNRVIEHNSGNIVYIYNGALTLQAVRTLPTGLSLLMELDSTFYAVKGQIAELALSYALAQSYDADRIVFNSFANTVINRVIESGDNRLVESGDNRVLDLENYLATSSITFIPTEVAWDGGIFYNSEGLWKRIESTVNINGEWKPANVYTKVSGDWKRIN